MTISSEVRKAGPFSGNDVTTSFPFSFKVFTADDVKAVRADPALAESTLTKDVDYTVTLNADQNSSPGGFVELASPLSTGYTLVLTSQVQNLQPTDLTNQGGFYPSVINAALDRATIQIQQLAEQVMRAVKVEITSTTNPDQLVADLIAASAAAEAAAQAAQEAKDAAEAAAASVEDAAILRDDLASVDSDKGAELVGFKQLGTGAVNRDVMEKLRESFSVKDFGAVGDGLANDAPAIQAAVNAVLAAGGGTVTFPAGDYRVNATVVVAGGGIALVGAGSAGARGARIVNGTTNGPAISVGDGATNYFRAAVRGLTFAQAGGVSPVAGNCGLRLAKLGQCTIDSVSVFNFPAALRNGIEMVQTSQTSLRNIQVQNCTFLGVSIDRCTDLYMTDSRSDANLLGFNIVDTNGLFFTNVTAYGNDNHGWRLYTDGLDNNRNHFFTNCIGDTSGSYNWLIEQCYESVFTACWGATQKSTSVNTFATGFILSGAKVKDIVFNGCYAVYNNSHGVQIVNARDITFIGLVAGDDTHGNGRSGAGSGVVIDTNVQRTRFYNCKFEHNASYGFEASASATDILFSGGVTRANTAGAVGPATVQNNCRVKDVIGYNPRLGSVTSPSVPASTASVTNTTGVDCTVYIIGGTVSAVYVAGAYVGGSTNISVFVPAGQTVRLDYSSAPVWKWMGH